MHRTGCRARLPREGDSFDFPDLHEQLEVSRLLVMDVRKSCEDRCSARRQRDDGDSAVGATLARANQTALLRTLDETDHGMKSRLEELRQLRYGGRSPPGESGDAKHKLMLLRSDATGPGGIFAETHEPAERVAKTREVSDHAFEVFARPFFGTSARPSACSHG